MLLVDEPTAGLSKMLASEVYEMLTNLARIDKLTILLVDQEIRQALKIADDVYVLELGRNKFEGPALGLPGPGKGVLGGVRVRTVSAELQRETRTVGLRSVGAQEA